MKTKFHSLFIVMALIAGVHSALAQPALGIVPTNNQAILFWPTAASGTNGVLQSTTNLTLPNWLSATDAVPVNYGSQTAVIVTNTASMRFFRISLVPPTSDGMAFIPAGSFTVGDTLDGESDAIPTNVYVSAFYMDTNLVSYGLWTNVYAYATSHDYRLDAGSGKNNVTNQPVNTVSWYDCVSWCNARSQQAGLTPVYYKDAEFTQVYTNGNVVPYVNWAANGYRLPTEAEWEKASRGGLSNQRFPWGNTISESQANYNADPGDYYYDLGPYTGYNTNYDTAPYPYTSPVGTFAANGYGLYDMAGNLAEWCWDWYAGTPYPTGSPYLGGIDPRGPASSPIDTRVVRGGHWDVNASFAQCADRDFYNEFPIFGNSYFGFRCVRGL